MKSRLKEAICKATLQLVHLKLIFFLQKTLKYAKLLRNELNTSEVSFLLAF